MSRKLIVGSRGSDLALKQTNWVIGRLRAQYPDYGFEIKIITTKGDKILDVTLDKIGGKGLFVKEIEQELLEGTIDMAVHSMKDVPSEIPPGLEIGAISQREDPRDVLVSREGLGLMDLPSGAVVGTSSLRRQVQLLQFRKDINIVPLRGNILTRLNKIKSDFDAIVLAAAGLKRAGLEEHITGYFDVQEFIPAVAQGALGIELRDNDEELKEMLQCVHHDDTACCVEAERSYLRSLNGGCHIPIGAYAETADGTLKIQGMLWHNQILKDTVLGKADIPAEAGIELARRITSKMKGDQHE